ncbi:uncharacterized protein METZ01_LOCUS5143 [marine metagenome]|uniref:Uncharacterized protein n=1 Tax=marine metagenome TaxID=408172 RepID=A0A381NCY4_9ZZZZ
MPLIDLLGLAPSLAPPDQVSLVTAPLNLPLFYNLFSLTLVLLGAHYTD